MKLKDAEGGKKKWSRFAGSEPGRGSASPNVDISRSKQPTKAAICHKNKFLSHLKLRSHRDSARKGALQQLQAPPCVRPSAAAVLRLTARCDWGLKTGRSVTRSSVDTSRDTEDRAGAEAPLTGRWGQAMKAGDKSGK